MSIKVDEIMVIFHANLVFVFFILVVWMFERGKWWGEERGER